MKGGFSSITLAYYWNYHSNKIVYACYLWASYLEEGKPFVPIDDHFKALVVNKGEEASVAQLVRGYRQFLQGHSYSALACSWGGNNNIQMFKLKLQQLPDCSLWLKADKV